MKKRVIPGILLIITTLFFSERIDAQTNTYSQKSIQVHISAMMYLFAGVDFEIYAWKNKKSVSGINVGAGYWDNGLEIPLYVYTLWNKESVHHIEVDTGLNLLIIPDDRVIPLPVLGVGYRYQDLLKKGLVFRAGLNLGIMPYLGLGYAF